MKYTWWFVYYENNNQRTMDDLENKRKEKERDHVIEKENVVVGCERCCYYGYWLIVLDEGNVSILCWRIW